MKKSPKNVDMGSDNLFRNIIKFAVPLILMGFFQRLFNAADIVVVGRYAGEEALAGVGSTGSLTMLLTNLFIGLSVGVSVVLGKAIGAKNEKAMHEIVHTSVLISIIAGIALAVCGFIFAEPLLSLTGVPDNVMPQAKIYMKIIFLGKFPELVYTFGAAVLRARGDTKRPLYIVSIAGVINFLLNLLFVIKFKMRAEGVATATAISHICTSFAAVYILRKEVWAGKLELKKLRIFKRQLVPIVAVGIPSGLQAMTFSFSNVIVQSSVNSFGTAVVAGNSAATNICGFFYGCFNSFLHASTSFISYSVGAKRFDRIKKIIWYCLIDVCIIWGVTVMISLLFGRSLLSLYAPGNSDVISKGFVKVMIVGCTYGMCGLMEVMTGALRGIGRSFSGMVASLAGVCGIRIVWVLTAFKAIGTLESLFICFPLSWMGTFLLEAVMFIVSFKKFVKIEQPELCKQV